MIFGSHVLQPCELWLKLRLHGRMQSRATKLCEKSHPLPAPDSLSHLMLSARAQSCDVISESSRESED